MATNPTVEGATAMYIALKAAPLASKSVGSAYGIPVGGTWRRR